MHDFLQNEELLIGLALLRQVFDQDTYDPQVARDVDRLYRGDTAAVFKAVVAASTLCLQRYAADSGNPEVNVIDTIRDDLLRGAISLAD